MSAPPADAAKPPKKRFQFSAAWREARVLVEQNKGRLVLGLVFMLVNRAAGLVLPWTTKSLIDDVVVNKRGDMLMWLALAGGAATLVQAATSFTLAQVLGVAAQKAINDMRKRIQAHVLRLPTRFFDDQQSGALISRIMNDAEGLRNLVGNGLVQLVGGVLTAIVALGVLFWLNWKLTLAILVVLVLFGVCMVWAFKTLRPLFQLRGKIQAEVTGRLNQTLGGIRVVKAYTAEPDEERVFTAGADRFFDNVRRSIQLGQVTRVATSDTKGANSSFSFMGGYDWTFGKVTVGPFIGHTSQAVDVNSFSESGAGSAGLKIFDQKRDSQVSSVGLRASVNLGAFTPFVRFSQDKEPIEQPSMRLRMADRK